MIHTVKYKSYDVRERPFRFDSYRLRHKNENWTGDRYALVFYNKDMNYVGRDDDARSTRIANEPERGWTWVPCVKNDEHAKGRLVNLLDNTRFPEDRCSGRRIHPKYGKNRGTFLSFGMSQSRKSRVQRAANDVHTRHNVNPNNAKHVDLYAALCNYVNTLVPYLFGTSDENQYTSCIVAKNSQCELHTDTGNIGPAVCMTLGNYSGGNLWVEEEQ